MSCLHADSAVELKDRVRWRFLGVLAVSVWFNTTMALSSVGAEILESRLAFVPDVVSMLEGWISGGTCSTAHFGP